MTTVYLIRHSQPMRDHIGTNYSNDSDQVRNEKNILTPEGETLAKELSMRDELQKIDILYTSNYVRAMSTAKYIAFNNDIELNIDERLGERKFGVEANDLPKGYFLKQWTDFDYKETNGESINDTRTRITEVINEIVDNNKGKNICIVSHGTALSSYLLNHFELRIQNEEFHWFLNDEEVFNGFFNAPHMFKLVFDEDNNLIEFKNIGK